MINSVIDISHHNSDDGKIKLDFAAAKAAGIDAVLHKATEGLGYVDLTYAPNRAAAVAAGMLWGAYHFGEGGDGVAQAELFLAHVGSLDGTLLALDLEPNPHGPTMTLAQARDFVTYVHAKTGRWPGLYSGETIKEELGNAHDPVLANCWLWLAEYGPKANVPANWPTWTMWQYTDGAIGDEPRSVPGIGPCDRDRFNGDDAGLRRLWGAP
jgi:lysozyme